MTSVDEGKVGNTSRPQSFPTDLQTRLLHVVDDTTRSNEGIEILVQKNPQSSFLVVLTTSVLDPRRRDSGRYPFRVVEDSQPLPSTSVVVVTVKESYPGSRSEPKRRTGHTDTRSVDCKEQKFRVNTSLLPLLGVSIVLQEKSQFSIH